MPFLGMRGSGDWGTDVRPQSFREGILFLYPNGDAPLTAILSKMKNKSVDDPQFHWWEKLLAGQGGEITTAYTDAGLSSAYASSGVAGDTLYLKVAVATANEFRPGHEVLIRYSADYSVDVVGKCTAVVKNGDSSYIAVKLLEDDDNSSSFDISDADRILVIGSINPEGGDTPDAIAYDPTKRTNYTQIFRTPMDITGTNREVKLRTGDQNKENQREALELHSIEMEKAFLWGIATENTGANGKPERTTGGLIPNIKAYAGANNQGDYVTDTDAQYAGSTWLDAGEDWIDEKLGYIFRFGAADKLAFCGWDALRGINRLAKAYGHIALTPMSKTWGMQIRQWITPFGVINIMIHPLFSYETTNVNSMVIFEPRMLTYRFLKSRDTQILKNRQGNGEDRVKDEFLTECGLEFHHMEVTGYLNGVGKNNTQ